MIQGSNESAFLKKLDLSCKGIEKWCNKWRMGVNGSKTELIVLNIEIITSVRILNNEECAIARVTKSLGLLIDDKLGYKEHVERVCNKTKCSWDVLQESLEFKWSLAIPALVLLYKTIIVPQLL